MKNNVQLFVATKAFIAFEGKILIIRESKKYHEGTQAGNYDVPGGRINPEQSLVDNLRREILEETGLAVTVGAPFFANEVSPTINGEKVRIVRIFYTCTTDTDKVTLSRDHDAYEWINPRGYAQHPIIKNLEEVFSAYNPLQPRVH